MDNEITKDTIKTLAQANGLNIPDARLDRVLKQYRSFMQLVARVDAFKLPMEAEPQTTFTLDVGTGLPGSPRDAASRGVPLPPRTVTGQDARHHSAGEKGDSHGN